MNMTLSSQQNKALTINWSKYILWNMFFVSMFFAYCLLSVRLCRFLPFKFYTGSSTGTLIYSEVRAFLKKQPDIMIKNKSIKTAKETITLTGNHLLYAREKFALKFNPM